MNGLSEEDIAAARAQGDLAALVLMSSGLTVKAPKQRTASAEPPLLPRTRPGAWPDGTRSPGLSPDVAEYLARCWPDRFAPIPEEHT